MGTMRCAHKPWQVEGALSGLHQPITMVVCALIGFLALSPEAAGVITIPDPITFDVEVGGEKIGEISAEVEGLGLGGDVRGTEGLEAKFQSTKLNPDGSTMTLDELEASLGQDHLNWFQKVTKDTNPPDDSEGNPLTVPYIDPPRGGYGDPFPLAGDDAPWYLQETPNPPGETRPQGILLSDNTMGSMLLFEDQPAIPNIAGASVSFDTFLISDFGNKSYQVLGDGFSWTVTMEEVAGVGILAHVTSLTKGTKFLQEYRQEISEEFGYSMVPEPSSIILFGAGLLGAAGFRRRRRPSREQ